jgi:hypothetical protein
MWGWQIGTGSGERLEEMTIKRAPHTSPRPAIKEYAVTINGETTNYSLLNEQDIPGCMLVKGKINQANLLESWFATTGEEPEDQDDDRYRGD